MPRSIIYSVAMLLGLAILFRLFQSPSTLDAIGDWGTTVAKPIFVPLVNLISKPSFVYIAALLILGSALTVIIYHLGGPVRRELSGLNFAARSISQIAQPAPAGWSAATAEITTVIAKQNVIVPAWTTYIEEAGQLDRLPPRRFSSFAESDPFNPANRRGSVVESLPSYYTTIGLILTFVGLVVALYFAARGFRSGDMVEAREAIVQLLNASAFKFLTSVAALLSALIISVAYRAGQWWLRQAVANLGQIIDLRLQPVQAAALLVLHSAKTIPTSDETFHSLTKETQLLRATMEKLVERLNDQFKI